MLLERRDQLLLQRQADAAEVSGMLRFGIDADGAIQLAAKPLCQLDHFVERRNGELAVVGVRPERETFVRAQRLDFGEREVLAEPARDGLAVNRLRRATR